MKKNGLLLCLLLILLFAGKNTAQTLNCNSLVQFSLDKNCAHTIIPEEILEGTQFPNCIVELDRVAPFGDGPWTSPVLSSTDVNKTYQVRVTHVPSGNKCWGNVKAEDKLPPVLECNGLSTIDLNGSGPVTVPTANLNITAVDACGATNLAPGSVQYDCNNMGVKTIQLTATDAQGNSSTCSHTILVSNATSCQACVSECPQSVTVSFEQGNYDLLQAFQTNNLGAFDVYGNALFDSGCTQLDSTYFVDYQPGTAGQSWFTRNWWWIDGSGQIVPCQQAIVFPKTHTVTVQGKVYFDTSTDCNPDAGEQGVDIFRLVTTKFPSGITNNIFPNPDGTYTTDIVFSALDTGAELYLALPSGLNSVCPSAINIPNSSSTPLHNFDIGLQSQEDCALMQVDLGNAFLRRCSNNTFSVKYCNMGLDTAIGAYVTVDFDSLISLQSASLGYTVSGPDSLYTFQLGDVPPFSCGTIYIQATVSCSAVLGQTLCSEANAYPNVPCGGAWAGAELAATAYCSGDSVTLSLRNHGQQDMTLPLNYIVVEDFIMYKTGAFQLNTGDSILIKAPANGATWRIEAPQTPGFPVSGLVAAAVEGCGGLNTPGAINIYGQSDNGISYDQYCGEVRGSFDPNDKTAVPVGYGEDHIIRANEPIEYKIRFQNTGTDTAFQVVVVDTISPFLDIRTLETGASSHPYRLDIFPGGILHFVFQPIALPDSNINEVASHGFLQFRIRQQPDLPDGTVLENTAAIYFDQNDPVLTNTAFHTIGSPILQIDPLANAAQLLNPTCNGASNGGIVVAPSGGEAPYSFLWSDPNLQGDTLTGLSAGTYQLTLTDSHGHELTQTFELMAPAPIILVANVTPAIGNDSNGTATVQATGGTGGFTYLWSNGATTASISDLFAGTYTVVVTDANGCVQNGSVVVPQTILPLIYSAQASNPSCYGAADGVLQLAITGGLMPYSILWSDPTLQGDVLTGLVAGAYEFTITDSNGSQFSEELVLTEPTPILISLSATPAFGNQNNGTASATVAGGVGGYTFLWSNGASTQNLSGLPAGTYSVIATDMNGCTQSNSVVVEQLVATTDPAMLSKIMVWPNPAHDEVLVDLQDIMPQMLRLDMLSADGRLLRQLHLDELKPLLTLNLENYRTGGMVLLVLHTRDGRSITEKVMIR